MLQHLVLEPAYEMQQMMDAGRTLAEPIFEGESDFSGPDSEEEVPGGVAFGHRAELKPVELVSVLLALRGD